MLRKILFLVLGGVTLLSCTTPPPRSKTENIRNPNRQTQAFVGFFNSDDEGLETRTVYYDNGYQTIVFGSQWNLRLAEKLLGDIRGVTRSPVTHAFILSANPSQWGGASYFRKKGIRVVTFKKVESQIAQAYLFLREWLPQASAKHFKSEDYEQAPEVDDVIDGDSYELRLDNGEKVKLELLPYEGPSGVSAVAYLSQSNAIIVGDLFSNREHAWMMGKIKNEIPRPDLQAWTQALRELKKRVLQKSYGYSTQWDLGNGKSGEPEVFGDRGEAAPLRQSISRQIAYIYMFENEALGFVKKLSNEDRAQLKKIFGSKKTLNQFRLRIANDFSSYTTSQMIELSAVGVLRSKL